MNNKAKIQSLNIEYVQSVKVGDTFTFKGAKKYIVSKVSEPITEYMAETPLCRYIIIETKKRQFFLYDYEFNNQFSNSNIEILTV